MFFTRQSKPARIFPVRERETETESESESDSENSAEAGTVDFDIEKEIKIDTDFYDSDDYTYNNKTVCYIDEDLSKLVLYNIMDQLLHKNVFYNEFGTINLSNIDEFEIDLFEIKSENDRKTYGFKVTPKGCIMMNGIMYDGIISNRCDHDVENWLPLFRPILTADNENANANLEWYVFINSSFCSLE
jgi:hypothetical protein